VGGYFPDFISHLVNEMPVMRNDYDRAFEGTEGDDQRVDALVVQVIRWFIQN
jgi:hypothetical protein